MIKQHLSIPTPDTAIAIEVDEYGIDFTVDERLLEKLKDLGAGPNLIASLRNIRKNQERLRSKEGHKGIVLVVANISGGTDGTVTSSVTDEIRNALRPFSNVVVRASDVSISSKEGDQAASSLGKSIGADIVIWGTFSRTNTHVRLVVEFETLSAIPNLSLRELRLVYESNTTDYENFSLHRKVANDASLLTMTALGFLEYSREQYSSAIKHLSISLEEKETISKFADLSRVLLVRASAIQLKNCGTTSTDTAIMLNDLEEAISLDAENFEAQLLLSGYYLSVDPSSAARLGKRAVESSKTNIDRARAYFVLLSIAVSNEDIPEAQMLAKEIIQLIINEAPSAEQQLLLSLGYLVADNLPEAFNSRQKAVDLASKASDKNTLFRTYLIWAEILMSVERNKEALEFIDNAIDIRPECPVSHAMRGSLLAQEGDPNETLSAYYQAIELNPQYVPALVGRAKFFISQGKKEEAKADLDRATKVGAVNRDLTVTYAEFYVESGMPAKAIESYTAFLMKRKDSVIFKARGDLLLSQGDREGAISDYESGFQTAVTQEKDYDWLAMKYSNYLRLLSNLGAYKAALRIAETFLVHTRDKSTVLKEIADLLAKTEDTRGAIEVLSDAIKIAPDQASLFSARASIYVQKNQLQEALRDINQAIRLDSNDPRLFEARANIFDLLGRTTEAIEDLLAGLKKKFEKITEIETSLAEITYFRLKFRLLTANNPAAGIKLAQLYQRRFPERSEGYETEAHFLDESGQPDSALQILNSAIAKMQGSKKLFLMRSTILEEKGNIDEAVLDLESVLNMEPNNVEILKRLANLHASNGDLGLALRALDRAIVHNEREVSLYLLRSKIHDKLENPEKAIDDLIKVFYLHMREDSESSSPDRRLHYLKLIIRLKDEERSELGLKITEDLLSHAGGGDTQAYIDKAYFLQHLGRISEAISSLRSASLLDSKNSEISRKLAEIYISLEEYPSALDAANQAIDLNNTEPSLYSLRSKVHDGLENSNGAIDDLAAAFRLQIKERSRSSRLSAFILYNELVGRLRAGDLVELGLEITAEYAAFTDSKSPNPFVDRAFFLSQSGDFGNALKNVEKALTIKRDANTLAEQARIYESMGDLEKAVKTLKDAIEISEPLQTEIYKGMLKNLEKKVQEYPGAKQNSLNTRTILVLSNELAR